MFSLDVAKSSGNLEVNLLVITKVLIEELSALLYGTHRGDQDEIRILKPTPERQEEMTAST